MTNFLPLEKLELGISAADVERAFQPFVDPNFDLRAWQEARWTRRKRTLRKAYRRGLGGQGERDRDTVTTEYEEAWSRGLERYDIDRGLKKSFPWKFRNRPMLADIAGSARFRNLFLHAVIGKLCPKRVLEVGCGDGINLLLLAGAFPEISFTGLELTEAGNKASLDIQKLPELPPHLLRYAATPQKDLSAFRTIAFMRGDATNMSFPDGHFDLVYTVLSIEQMEVAREAALREISRVTGQYLLNLEPFAEANRDPWRRLYVWSRNYFRGKISDMPRYGLEPQWSTMDFPQEVMLGAALVLSRKTGK
jgi:ubiquinone/menaquinone biosynthesis C-methylase UbiE